MRTALILSALLLAAPAFAQSVGERTGVTSTLGAAPTTADFVKQAASSDLYEIQSSQLVQIKGTEKGKQFAIQMITDHQRTSTELKQMAGKNNIEVPAQLLPTHQKLLDNLNGLTSEKLSAQYIDDQVTAHKDAVSLFERYSKAGDNSELKEWATKTLPALQHHLEMAQTIDKAK